MLHGWPLGHGGFVQNRVRGFKGLKLKDNPWRRDFKKALAGLFFLLLAGVLACAHEAVSVVTSTAVSIKEVPSPPGFERQLAGLINEERGRQRLRPLTFSSRLARTGRRTQPGYGPK